MKTHETNYDERIDLLKRKLESITGVNEKGEKGCIDSDMLSECEAEGLELLKKCPDRIEVRKIMASVYNFRACALAKSDSDKAIEYIEKAYEFHSNDADISMNRSVLYVMKYEAEGRYKEAINIVEKMIILAPGNINVIKAFIDLYVKLGAEQMNAQEFEGAVTTYEKALEYSIDHLECMFHLGNAYYGLGRKVLNQTTDIDKALHCFENVNRLSPHHRGGMISSLFIALSLKKSTSKIIEFLGRDKVLCFEKNEILKEFNGTDIEKLNGVMQSTSIRKLKIKLRLAESARAALLGYINEWRFLAHLRINFQGCSLMQIKSFIEKLKCNSYIQTLVMKVDEHIQFNLSEDVKDLISHNKFILSVRSRNKNMILLSEVDERRKDLESKAALMYEELKPNWNEVSLVNYSAKELWWMYMSSKVKFEGAKLELFDLLYSSVIENNTTTFLCLCMPEIPTDVILIIQREMVELQRCVIVKALHPDV